MIQEKGKRLKKYLSISHIYLEKLAELCSESFYDSNSYNLLLCERLNREGWSWKVIYFALLEYRSWCDRKWNEELLESLSSSGLEKETYFGKNKYDSKGYVLEDFLTRVRDNIDDYIVAEEFLYRNID